MIENKIKGEFEVTVLRNGETHFHSKFSNMLLDYAFSNGSSDFELTPRLYSRYYASVGTGTTAPVSTQTGLQGTRLGTSQPSNGNPVIEIEEVNATTSKIKATKTYTFDLGTVVGNASEIVISNSTDGTNPTIRSLIKDANGNPTSITLTNTDQLIIKHTLVTAVQFNTLSPAFSKTIKGTTHNFYVAIDKTLAYNFSIRSDGSTYGGFNNYVWYARYYKDSVLATASVGTLLGQQGLDTDTGSSIYPQGGNGEIPNVLPQAKRYTFREGTRKSSKYYGFPIRLALGNFTGISCIEFETYSTAVGSVGDRPKLRIFIDPPLNKDNTQYLGFTVKMSVSADE